MLIFYCYFLRRAHSSEQTPLTREFPSGTHLSAENKPPSPGSSCLVLISHQRTTPLHQGVPVWYSSLIREQTPFTREFPSGTHLSAENKPPSPGSSRLVLISQLRTTPFTSELPSGTHLSAENIPPSPGSSRLVLISQLRANPLHQGVPVWYSSLS